MLFADLVEHSEAWHRLPRTRMVDLIGEYRYVAEGLAGVYGSIYREWAGDGHMFLFENADTAAQFGLRLIEGWRRSYEESEALSELPHLPIRIGAHFGECSPIAGEGWVGRANGIAKRVEAEADPDAVFVTESLLDLLDLPLYTFEPVGPRRLKGDHLLERKLYRLLAFDHEALAAKPPEALTPEEWFLRGVTLVGTPAENSDDEERCWRAALELRPSFAEAHNNLAILLRSRGQDHEAAPHYQEALRLRPDYPEAHFNYAAMLASRGSSSGAIDHYNAALQLRPDYVDAHHGLAGVLTAQGRVADAESHYREALRLRPDSVEAHNDLAVLLERAGQLDEAADQYREALRIDDDSPQTHYNYALLLESGGDQTGAEDHYRAAIRLWPGYGEAHNNLAILLQDAGDLARAEEHYRKALDARPDDPETHHNYGLFLRARGEHDAAEHHLRIAHDLAPDVPAFRSALEVPR
ncbi:hypothetical protein BH09ACT13_BH09ACT13_02020 [soil metagenome]